MEPKNKIMRNLYLAAFFILISLSCSEDMANPDGAQNQGQGGSMATFTLKGNYLYVVDEMDLNVFSLLKTDNPVLVNKVPIGFNIETLFGYKDYLYIGSRDGMFIYDLSDPESPQELSSVQHFTACDPVVANDSLAFVTLHSNTFCGNNINVLEVYDISTVTEPVLITSRNLMAPKGLGLYGKYLIVCDDEIKIFDISVPENTILVNAIDKQAFDVIIRGDLLIAIGENGLYQYQLNSNREGIDISVLSEIEL